MAHFESSEFVDDWLIEKELDVFGVIECPELSAALVYFLRMTRLHWVHSFQDT